MSSPASRSDRGDCAAATVEGSPTSRPGNEWVLVERDVPRYPHEWRLIFRRGDEVLEVYVPEEVWRAFDS